MQCRLRVLQVLLAVVAVGSLPLAGRTYAQTTGQQINELLRAYHEAGMFDGAALVAESGNIVFQGGFGLADRGWSVPNTSDTRFAVGSLGKLFTAILTLQLVSDGAVEMIAPIGDYLPQYDPAGAHSVTVRRLLSHTAALPDYAGQEFLEEGQFIPMPHEVFVERHCMVGPSGEAGAEANYSSTHYCLLGAAVASITGQGFEAALHDRVLGPLGMANTGLHLHDRIVHSMAAGYLRTLSGYRNGPSVYPDLNSYGAGGMYSTVGDLFRLDRALYDRSNGVIALRDSLYLRIAPSGFERGHYFGLGATVAVTSLGPGGESRTVHRAGGNTSDGHTAVMTRVLEDEHAVILLTNAGPGWFDETVHEITRQILAILYDREYTTPAFPIERELFAIIEREGTERLAQHFAQLKNEGELSVSLGGIYGLGTELLRLGRTEEAVDVFELLVDEYPNSSWSHNGLGEAYLANGDRELAIVRFEKALELNPENPQAAGNLRRLGVLP